MSDGWSEGWPTISVGLPDDENNPEPVETLVVPLSEAVPKSELQPILDGFMRDAIDMREGFTFEQRDQVFRRMEGRLAALLSPDSEEG